jgi:dipeptidyl aminopeptidase/acylaminoacyl peptidase
VRQSPLSPTNLYLIDLKANPLPFRLTNNTIGGLEQAGLVEPETVHWISPDGLEIEGLLYKPADFEPGKHPALVHIHGGPISQYHRRWDGAVQYLVGRGWVVIEPNFRGSTGYGRNFRRALQGTWGQEDMLDNLGALEYLKKNNLCQPERIVAWGGSGGGYATMLLLSKWPDAFKAGVALVGVTNFVSFPEQTDRFAKYLMHSILGPRADNFKLFEERSPVTYAHQVKAPLQILMGEKDYRVPVAQADEMVEALKKAGISNYEYHVYEGEGHGWRKQINILDYISRMEKFLEKWVLER